MVSLLDAAAECFFRVLLSECCVRFGAGLLVPLQGARVQGTRATKKTFAIWGPCLRISPKSVSTLRGSYGKCKGRCLIRVLTLGTSFFPVNFA